MLLKQLLRVLTSLIAIAVLTSVSAEDSIWLRRHGFRELRQGSATDGGQNLYVSHKGRLQTINRLDLNVDGEIDLVFTQDHNSVYAPDSLIYWGGPEGFQSLLPELRELRAGFSLLTWMDQAQRKITRLPTMGGGRGQVSDLNGDGYLDIVVANFMHNLRTDQEALIYWGSDTGFSATNRSGLPALLASGVAVGDLNDDGFPEVVLSNRGDERGETWGYRLHLESYIYWGGANGYDASRRKSLATISAVDVAMGDFNGDGHQDLAFVNFNKDEQSVFIYFNDGAGDFSRDGRQVLSREDLKLAKSGKDDRRKNGGMHTLLATRLNDDAIDDLIVAGTDKSVVYYGGARGPNLKTAFELPADNCQGVAAADLNGDGLLEIVLANQGPASTIFWASADGYDPQRCQELPTLGAASVQIADLNRDNILDILFGNSRDETTSDVPSYIYWGGEDGYSVRRRQELSGFGTIGSGAADFDRDGWPDVLLISHLSSRNATLPAAIYWGNREHHYGSTSITQLDVNPHMEHSIADLDDDGFPDLVFLKGPADRAMVMWGSQAGFHVDNRTDLPVEGPGSSSIADLNRDGSLDIFFIKQEGSRLEPRLNVMIVWGNLQRMTDPQVTQVEAALGANESNAIADMNRDGYLDLVVATGSSRYSHILYGSESGYSAQNAERLRANGAPHANVADLDRDGWLDVIFTSGADIQRFSVHTPTLIHWGGPDGFVEEVTELESYTGLDAVVADLNRDGHLDIAITNYRSDIHRKIPTFVYWGDGGRNFGEHRRSLIKAASGAAVDALDLNRDGWLELIVSNHQEHFDHAAAGTDIFWGGEQGFDHSRRTVLPTVGVHLDAMVDAGNIYDREYHWTYEFDAVHRPTDTKFARLHWTAETKLDTAVTFQARSAVKESELADAAWAGPDGNASFFSVSPAKLAHVPANHHWLQYRAVFKSPDGANTAYLDEVAVELVR